MPQIIDVPGYGPTEFPDGMSDQQIVAAIQKNMVKTSPVQEPKKEHGLLQNLGLGALKGATDIGATLLTPLDKTGLTGMTPEQRRQSLASFYQENADPESYAFKGGELGTNIAGTAGAGGVLAKGALAAGRAIPALTQYAPKVATALETGGFKLGTPAATTTGGKLADMALRTGAGAVTGGAMAGMVDPESAGTGALIGGVMPGAVKVAGMAGQALRAVPSKVVGFTTGTGEEAAKQAYKAGKEGKTSFLNNMRGNADMNKVVEDARSALDMMRQERSNAYRSGMVDIKNDKAIIDMTPIIQDTQKAMQQTMYGNKVTKPDANKLVGDAYEKIADWVNSDPAQFHTPEGLDQLKQMIGDILDHTQPNTNERRLVGEIYNSVRSQITAQAPTYAKVMKDYSEANDLIREIQKTLVGTEKTSIDTALRKLQSIMRNNVNTNYGNRTKLMNELNTRVDDLMPSLAGQAMSSATPRGLQGLAPYATLGGAFANPVALAALPFQSPRLMGEAAYGLGALVRGAKSATSPVAGKANQMANLLLNGNASRLPVNQGSSPMLRALLATSSANP